MKNLGIFLPVAVGVDELVKHGTELGGEFIDEMTLRFGIIPEEAYLNVSTDLADGCFDAEEFDSLRRQLGFAPVSYVSVHMNYTPSAARRAYAIARSIQERWKGTIDFSGAGGNIGQSSDDLGLTGAPFP